MTLTPPPTAVPPWMVAVGETLPGPRGRDRVPRPGTAGILQLEGGVADPAKARASQHGLLRSQRNDVPFRPEAKGFRYRAEAPCLPPLSYLAGARSRAIRSKNSCSVSVDSKIAGMGEPGAAVISRTSDLGRMRS